MFGFIHKCDQSYSSFHVEEEVQIDVSESGSVWCEVFKILLYKKVARSLTPINFTCCAVRARHHGFKRHVVFRCCLARKPVIVCLVSWELKAKNIILWQVMLQQKQDAGNETSKNEISFKQIKHEIPLDTSYNNYKVFPAEPNKSVSI